MDELQAQLIHVWRGFERPIIEIVINGKAVVTFKTKHLQKCFRVFDFPWM